MGNTIIEQINEQVMTFPDKLQWQVLEFVQSLKSSAQRGVPGIQLLRFAGAIPLDDLDTMRLAIEAGCGQVDLNEW